MGVIGRAVVGIFNVAVAPLVLDNVIELLGLKLQLVPVGFPLQDRLIAEPKSGDGVS